MAVKMKNVPDEEYLHQGSLGCSACPEVLVFRHALKVLGPNTIVINATGCLAVVMQMAVPKVPHFHVLFENAPALMSGIDDALKAQGKREGTNLLVVAGDGATADIGLSALSGAIERNQDIIYVCFDNESYMNTGGQRSGTTSFGARTSTTPVGSVVQGEDRLPGLRKDVVEIVAAHGAPYVASTTAGYPLDFMERLEKAAKVRGPSYIHCHCPCPTGWGVETKDIIKVSQLAVKTRCIVMYEIENGVRRPTRKVSKKKTPVLEYLKYQARYRHLNEDSPALVELQQAVDDGFEALMAKMDDE